MLCENIFDESLNKTRHLTFMTSIILDNNFITYIFKNNLKTYSRWALNMFLFFNKILKSLEIYNEIIFSRSIQVERPANIIFLKYRERE